MSDAEREDLLSDELGDEDEIVPPPSGNLDREGIPDHEGPLRSKEATGDQQDGIAAPGDRPWAADDDAVTAAGQREGSTFDERLSLEQPDVAPAPLDDVVGEIVDEDRPDHEPDMVGDLAPSEEDTAPAEELAMRITEDAPGATSDDSDGYVEDDLPDPDGPTG